MPNDVDSPVTLASIDDAINAWALENQSPAYELLLFVIGEGTDSALRLNASESLTPAMLDQWLDSLQSQMPGSLLFIYDACRAGSFLPHLSPPEGKTRILISGSSNEAAVFANQGALSFSFQFWQYIFNGFSIDKATAKAGKTVMPYQTALLESDADSAPNQESDYGRVTGLHIGRGYLPEADTPHISFISGPRTLDGDTSATVWAEGIIDANGIERVFASILPSGYRPVPDVPILELPVLELTDTDSDGRYEGVFSNFVYQREYDITVIAIDNQNTYSLPLATRVTQEAGIKPGDINWDGSVNLRDAIIALKLTAGLSVSSVPGAAGAEMGGDGRIGLSDAIYAMQAAAGMHD